MKKSSLINISDESILQNYSNGVKLITKGPTSEEHSRSIGEIYKLPLNLGFLDGNSIIHSINEHTIKIAGYKSIKDTLGKTVRIAARKEAADYSINHDKTVFTKKKLIIGEENYLRLVDDGGFQAITIKLPWYDKTNKIIGVFFCAFPFNSPTSLPLTESLNLIINLGILNNSALHNFNSSGFQNFKKFNIYFSKRESECLFHLIRGKTAKLIAKELNISYRTIQHYIENIKIKMGVSTRSQLIEKAIDENFIISS